MGYQGEKSMLLKDFNSSSEEGVSKFSVVLKIVVSH